MFWKERPSSPHFLRALRVEGSTFLLVVGKMACLPAAVLESAILLCGGRFAVLRVSHYKTRGKRSDFEYRNLLLCHSVLMGQVMQRMQLTWLGEPGPLIRTKNSFKVVLVLVISYFVYSLALAFATLPYSVDNVPGYLSTLKLIGSILFSLWALYSLCRTRESIRARYSITEQRCAGCEDLCCALWCSCCTVAQLARHTGEYETYPATCCTQTGQPAGTPFGV